MDREIIDSYIKKTRALFSLWKSVQGTVSADNCKVDIDHKNGVFISDGVVCPEIWFSQTVRPLFLLKEAHGGNADWNLAKDHLLEHKPIDKMWERISAWVKGMFSEDESNIPPFVDNDSKTAYYGNEFLKKIAVVNVKKSGGKSSSEYDEIGAYAEFDKERLKEQIEICDPTVIVCGYTSSYLETIMGEDFRTPRNDNLIYHICLNGHDVLVIDYWHPANHYPDIMNYYGFMGIYKRSILDNKR